jgi:hypothetical protein
LSLAVHPERWRNLLSATPVALNQGDGEAALAGLLPPLSEQQRESVGKILGEALLGAFILPVEGRLVKEDLSNAQDRQKQKLSNPPRGR